MGPVGLILRGEVYNVDLGQPIGHEPAFQRPAIVVSADVINNGAGGLVAVVPVTSTRFGLRSHVEIEAGPSGLQEDLSYARCDQARFISTERLSSRRGLVPVSQLRAIDQALRFVLDL